MSAESLNLQWASKAAALDRYRWLLLRERYSWAGSALRFIRDALVDMFFGIAAHFRLASTVNSESCDFLLLQSAPKVIALQRKKLLIAALRSRGHALIETALPEVPVILSQRQLVRPPQPVPLRYFGYAAYTAWLVERYTARVVLNDRNGSLYSPFLRLALNARQRLLVHLAHATTVESSQRLGMNDYDYYFLFGQSSLEALQARVLRFGSSQAVLAGSHMIDSAYVLPPAKVSLRTVLILGVGPDKEKEASYQATYALLRDWAETNPEYRVLVKAHPRSRASFWQQAAIDLANLHVLPATSSLAEALGCVSLVVNIMSNAVIEAALALRPVLFVNAGSESDIFDQERFFGPRIKAVSMLQRRIVELEAAYDYGLLNAQAFAEHHLSQGHCGLSVSLRLLEDLLSEGCCTGVPLPATCPVETNSP